MGAIGDAQERCVGEAARAAVGALAPARGLQVETWAGGDTGALAEDLRRTGPNAGVVLDKLAGGALDAHGLALLGQQRPRTLLIRNTQIGSGHKLRPGAEIDTLGV